MTRFLTLLAIVSSAAGVEVHAQCATQVSAPPTVTVCPGGDITTAVTFLDAAGTPCAFEPVTMSIVPFALGSLWLAPGQPANIAAVTDAQGVARFSPSVGGCYSGPIAVAYYNGAGTLVGTVGTITSGDFTADGQTNLQDFVVFQALFLTSDACGDYDGNGSVGLTDFQLYWQHFLH